MSTYCSVCDQPRAIRKDGTVRLHQRGPHQRSTCPGSHLLPVYKPTGYVWAPGPHNSVKIEPRP